MTKRNLDKAAMHFCLASAKNQLWSCNCHPCGLLREEGLESRLTPAVELRALLKLLRTSTRAKTYDNLSTGLFDELLAKKRLELRKQIEIEESIAKKAKDEPPEGNFTHGPLTCPQIAGGGRRIIRKGYELS
jgi:hypothetical protein